DEYINHLITNNKYMHALVTIESNKAPTLNDIMEDVYQKDVYQKLSDLNTKHQLEIQDFIKQNSQTSEISDENILIKYSQITQKQQQEKKELEISLNIRTVPVSSSLSANDIHLAQNHLPDDTAILSFYISKELSGLFILLNNSKKFVKLNIDENSLYLLASELRASIINPYTDYYKESSVKLYSALFGEVLKHLNKNIKNLIVVSDNVLSSIPFSPLYDGKSFLIENYSIYRVPSLRFIKSFAI
ncbi:MAG TPA: CHAT domain-containing protein, partial [Thermodesulfobacteriota bacterium]|nr:CHAT domain-containing protein [Thermodesulfobacteriota bacterium]